MSDKSLLQQAFEMLDDYETKCEGSSLVLMAVEFNKEGFPTSRAMKCVGAPNSVLASIRLLGDMLDELEDETLSKIDKMADVSDKLKTLFEQLGIEDMNDPRISKMMKDPNMSSEFMDLLKELKRKFGK
jgi:hypothetical protein